MDPDPLEARHRRPEHWVVLGGALLGLFVLVGFGYFLEPDPRGYGTHERFGFKPCLPMEAWNVPCPGCGVTTSVSHATKGEILASLRAQPFGLLLAVGTIVFIGWALVGHFRGRDLWQELSRLSFPRWASIAALLLAVAWIYKIVAVRGLFG